MARSHRVIASSSAALVAVAVVVIAYSFTACSGANTTAPAGGFMDEFDVIWGGDHVRVTRDDEGRQVVALTLDRDSGSGIQSKDQFLFGEFSMEMKLVPGDSAGTVATFYLTSEGEAHDEIDFEFLGNVSGQPYVMHTNVFAQGKGDREQQFYLWFDPTADFHNYTILWNPLNIMVHASLWNGDFWATRGGQVKINWADAPFVASYRGYASSACATPAAAGGASHSGHLQPPNSSPSSSSSGCGGAWMSRQLGPDGERSVAWARENYLIYDYCGDWRRFPQGRPPECNLD